MESSSARTVLKAATKVAVIGAGWAGLAAAITAVQAGHQVTLFEASRHWGGRARRLPMAGDGRPPLDNGQHILIGVYHLTLQLMRMVGLNVDETLWRLPLNLKDVNGNGLSLPNVPFPLNLLWGIASAKGWRTADKWSLLKTAWRWQDMQFECDEAFTVRDVCLGLSPKIWHDLIEPLCVSALNTPAHQASGLVFLRVLKDAVFGAAGSADLLLPGTDLGEVFPHSAIQWLQTQGASCQLGARIDRFTLNEAGSTRWQVLDLEFDHIVLATPAWDAAQLVMPFNPSWSHTANALVHEAIATVYVQAPPDFKLPQPMLALTSNSLSPAQFAFDRGQMMLEHQTPGLLAFVVSAAQDHKRDLEIKVLHQARELIRILNPTDPQNASLSLVQTVIEKRATFACTPKLQRPSANPFEGLSVCGDYVTGPYPATLEGAVMSGCAAGRMAGSIST
jgi:squalene-associated FAD-dependent desaturase